MPTALAEMLRAARASREMSFRDVREATGLSLSHLQRLERGEVAEPSPAVLRKLGEALGLGYDDLMREAGYL